MKRELFRHLNTDLQDYGKYLSEAALKFAVEASSPQIAVIFDDVNDLAECALCIFRGRYPVESPFFFWGKSMDLPWFDQYWKEDGEFLSPIPIASEIAAIQDELAAVAEERSPTIFPANTYASEHLLSDLRLKVQGLVVETLMSIDAFVELVLRDKIFEAMPWLSSAYKFEMEVSHFAWAVADRSSNARSAANARHVDTRAMKKLVFEWCDENMSRFSSMDDAALDIAETFVPQKFRTVRDWMTYWKKLRSAGTP